MAKEYFATESWVKEYVAANGGGNGTTLLVSDFNAYLISLGYTSSNASSASASVTGTNLVVTGSGATAGSKVGSLTFNAIPYQYIRNFQDCGYNYIAFYVTSAASGSTVTLTYTGGSSVCSLSSIGKNYYLTIANASSNATIELKTGASWSAQSGGSAGISIQNWMLSKTAS